MNNRFTLFKQSIAHENYITFKALFIVALNETENKCLKICANKYDQERNYNVGYHPAIEYDKALVKASKIRIKKELENIEQANKNNPERALHDLLFYGNGLSESYFKNLFMTILAGKLKEHWAPVVNTRKTL